MMFVAKEPVETLVDYRRFGSGSGLPLLFLQHFTGTLDNWDPAVTDALASGREVILFESAGLGRSTGKVPDTIGGMAKHASDFLDGLSLKICDVLGFSLGGMVAQQMAQDRPSIFPSRHGLSRKREAMPEEPHMRLDMNRARLPSPQNELLDLTFERARPASKSRARISLRFSSLGV